MSDLEQRFPLEFRTDPTPEPGLIRKDDGSVWLVNPDGTQTKLSSSSAGAVVVSPADSSTNVIVPTLATVVALTLTGDTAQTANLLNAGLHAATPFFQVSPGQAVGIGAGTFNPSNYGGYGAQSTRFVISNGDFFGYNAGAAPAVTGGSGTFFVPIWVETVLNQTANGGLGSTGIQIDQVMTGTGTSIGLYGVQATSYFAGTKTATSGSQLSAGAIAVNGTAVSDGASTGDLFDLAGGIFQAQLNGPNVINHAVSGIRSYANVGNAAAVASVRALDAGYFKVSSSGRTVAEAHGIQVDKPDGPNHLSVNYGIRVQDQSGAGISYGITVEGGNNVFTAAAATQNPMLVKGASGQSANLIEARDSSNNVLAAVTPAGNLTLNTGVGWTVGTGSPEGAVTAPVGSLYTDKAGGVNTTLYVKQSGTGNTGWAAK